MESLRHVGLKKRTAKGKQQKANIMAKVYTRTGDKGTTSLANGERVGKDCGRLEAYGTVDELNSHVGMLRALMAGVADGVTDVFLVGVQNELFVVGGVLAGAGSLADVDVKVAEVESEIDRLSALVPQLKSFILPAGCRAACEAHVCRTVCRRAERLTWCLEGEDDCARYLNRLSDYLFVLARYLNVVSDVEEQSWG